LTDFDFIVVGSGTTGSMAAQTLVESGARVLMLDGGRRDVRYADRIPERSFVELRERDDEQYRYFLGDAFESAVYRKLGAGAQLTPPRRFVVDAVETFLQTESTTFAPVESLALGGLGSAWGLLCSVFSDAELERASLPAGAMRAAYQTIADRIGISGSSNDDATPYTCGALQGVQPPLPLDPTAAVLLSRYERGRRIFANRHYHLGRPALALLTQDRGARRATALRDMDFYDNAERAAWRPPLTLEALRRAPNFSYAGDVLVTRFAEDAGGVAVAAIGMSDSRERHFSARRVVLACGALGTARIVLRSLAGHEQPLPLLCNAYTYAPCIVPERVGKAMPEKNTGLVQLVLFHDRDGAGSDVAVGTIFSYRALMLFRLLRETPLNVRDARALLHYLESGLLIVGIDHPQAYSEGKALRLTGAPSSPTGDTLAIDFALTQAERASFAARERDVLGVLRRLGAWPIKRVRPPLGSSIHYAGTLPLRTVEAPFTCAGDGRLRGTRNVFVVDGSTFTFLPAKGITFTLMANAHRIADGLTR
jgi:choline dehydrogenase-like flavoprotein